MKILGLAQVGGVILLWAAGFSARAEETGLTGLTGLTSSTSSTAPDSMPRAVPVILDEMGVKNLLLQTAEVEEVAFEETVFALGRIAVAPGKRAVVSSRIPGRALQVLAYPDTEVLAGAPMVVVESRQPGEPPPTVTLTAPIGGWVTELAVAPGEPVSSDKALLAILDLSVVHARAEVPQHFADQVRKGQRVRITVSGWPGEVFESEVAHVGVEVDPVTQSLEVACHVKNEGTWLRPGMVAEFQFITRSRPGVLAVPRSAVLGEGAQRYVFRTDDELKNAFVKAPVVVGAANDQWIEIREGLFSGDMIVTHGGYALSFVGKGSVSLKEALDAAHGHAHNEDGSEMTQEQQASARGGSSGAGAGAQGRDHEHQHDGGHEAESAKAFSAWTWFFAGTSAILFLLLVASSWRGPAGEGIGIGSGSGSRSGSGKGPHV